jgi:hypothetical protein
MILYHLTPRENVGSICERGLLLEKAQTGHKVIWLCAGSRVDWAAAHCARRHSVDEADLAMFRVNVRWEILHRHSRCLWYCELDIPPTSIYLCRVSSQSTQKPCEVK